MAPAESVLDHFEDGFNGLLSLGAADVRAGDHGVDDIELDHASLRFTDGTRC